MRDSECRCSACEGVSANEDRERGGDEFGGDLEGGAGLAGRVVDGEGEADEVLREASDVR